MTSVKLLIADDHQIIIDGIKAILEGESSISIVKECNNGLEVLNFLKSNQDIDVAILDINMPVMDGIECASKLKLFKPDQKILILTMHNDPNLIRKLMEVGADGFILKNTGKTELLTAIQLIMDGHTYFGQEVTQTLAKSFHKVSIRQEIKLTRREKDVLKLLFEGNTTHEIADKLFISSHTVDSHRKNLLSKFGVKNTTSLLREAGRLSMQ
jgi:two-component system, NarL family, nitrate/nitrite response regulator NarL